MFRQSTPPKARHITTRSYQQVAVTHSEQHNYKHYRFVYT